ncbi:MAG: ankyrin repeat domain-containing protein [Bacteroidota bacterium]
MIKKKNKIIYTAFFLLVAFTHSLQAYNYRYIDTQLRDAAQEGDLELVKSLIEQGADVNAVDAVFWRTPLNVSAKAGHFDVVKYLVKKGADVHYKDRTGQTALDRTRDEKIAKYLKKKMKKRWFWF